MSGWLHRFLNIVHKKTPARLIINLNWFRRPGIASALRPIEGIVHAWITSDAVTKSRISVSMGTTIRLSTSSNRNSPLFKCRSCVINESNMICGKSLYSYLQYHWWPMILIVIAGWFSSSIKYNKRRDGKANNIKIILGIIVQMSSVLWASFIVRL